MKEQMTKHCGFDCCKHCTKKCKYFDTCTRNPYKEENKSE